MKKKVAYISIYSAVLALMLAAEAMVVYNVIKLGMVPDLYIAALIAVFAVLLAGTAALLFIPGKGKKVGIAWQIIACILAVLTVAGCWFITPKIRQLHSTVEQITTVEPTGPVRNIYVLKDDPATAIQDISGYTFAALQLDEYCTEQVVDALETELGKTVTVQYFDNESLMITAFYNGEVGALILNDGYLSIWEENELFDGFLDKVKLLHTVSVTESKPDDQTMEPIPEPEVVADITNTPFVIYISGCDNYDKTLTRTRSDVNILMVVNPATKQILMVNTPRDYYIVHPWGNGGRDKLTHCGIYGIDCSIAALQNLYGVPVNYYVQLNYTGFETLIDSIGGITVYSDFAFQGIMEVYINAGENHLNGKQALAFARDRYNQPGGDNGRGLNQMKVIKAVIDKITNARTLIANYSGILKSVEGLLATNMPMEDLTKLVKMQLTDMPQWNILSYTVTGYDNRKTTYSAPSQETYVMVPNQYTVNYGKELIQKVIDGEILTQEDMSR